MDKHPYLQDSLFSKNRFSHFPYDSAESLSVAATVNLFPFTVAVTFVTSGALAMLKGAVHSWEV